MGGAIVGGGGHRRDAHIRHGSVAIRDVSSGIQPWWRPLSVDRAAGSRCDALAAGLHSDRWRLEAFFGALR